MPNLVHTLDKNYSKLSNFSNELLKRLKQETTDKIGDPIITYLNTTIISADKNKAINLDLPYENGDIGTDITELLYISKEGDFFSVQDYRTNYSYNEKEIINSIIPDNHYESSNSKNVEVECSYSITNNTFEVHNFSNLHFDKYIKYSYLTIGFIKEKSTIYSIEYKKDISIKNITNLINCTKIVDMFLINQAFDDNVFILFQNQNNEISFYHIQLTNLQYSLIYNKTIYLPKNIFPNTLFIKKIGYLNHIYYILTKSQKLIKMVKHDINHWTTQYVQVPDNNYIIDFVICQKTIYSLIEKIGLVIYKIGDKFVSNITFHLDNTLKLDHYINPFNGNEFVGILFKPTKESYELFMELLINHENFPQVNKILLSSPERDINNFYLIDNFFSYLYDNTYKEMIYIRRGMLNSIPDIIYKFYLSNITEKIENSLSILDLNPKYYNYPLLISKNNFYMINITLGKHKLNCTFYSDGSFNLTFIQRGEVCAESLEESIENPFATCQKIVTYNFHIYDSDFKLVTLSVTISIGLLILSFIILMIVIICGNHFMKNLDHHVNLIMQKDKKSLYEDNDEKKKIETTIQFPSFDERTKPNIDILTLSERNIKELNKFKEKKE